MNHNAAIEEFIRRRRRQLMVHRYIYYCRDRNLIPDQTYDKWNAELLQMERDYPDIAALVEYNDNSPTKTVGSSYEEDYPLWVIRTAQGLLGDYTRRSDA